MPKRSRLEISPQQPSIPKKRRKKRTAPIPANSVSSNILIACVIMEWQAEILKPAIFQPFNDEVSLPRAIKAQLREFKQNVKPIQYKKIYDRLLNEAIPGIESKSNRREIMVIRKQIGEILATQKKDYETFQKNSYGLPQHKINAKLRDIFQFPEVAISNLFQWLPASDEPRKFRKTNRNPIGFEIIINDETELELLDGYDFDFDFDKNPYKRKQARSAKVLDKLKKEKCDEKLSKSDNKQNSQIGLIGYNQLELGSNHTLTPVSTSCQSSENNSIERVVVDIFDTGNDQSPTVPPSSCQQNSQIGLIGYNQLELGSNHTLIPASTSCQSSENNSIEHVVVDIFDPNTTPPIASSSSYQQNSQIHSFTVPELFQIIDSNMLENLNTKAEAMENYRRQLISLQKQIKRYRKKIETNKQQLRNECEAQKNENEKLKKQLKSYESNEKSTLGNFEKEIEAQKNENKKLKKQLKSYESNEKSTLENFEKEIKAQKNENEKLKKQLKSYESNEKSTLENFERKTEAQKNENEKLKEQLASYHSWEKAVCHIKKCQTVIALKELLEAVQLQPSNENIKAKLDETAKAIRDIDIKKLKTFEEAKAEEYYLNLFGFESVGVWRTKDIQKIVNPIKKILNQSKNEWNNVVLSKINDLFEQLQTINYNKK